MGADALYADGGGVSGEAFILEIPGRFTIERVGIVGAQLFQIDLVDATADLFVGREQDFDRPVLDVGILDKNVRRSG